MRGIKWILVGVVSVGLSCGGVSPKGFIDNGNGQFKIVAPFGTMTVGEDRAFELKGPETLPFLIMVKDRWDRNVYLGYVIPDQWADGPLSEFAYSGNFQIGDRSTALALVAMNPMFIGMSVEQKMEVLKLILSTPSFNRLVEEVASAVERNGTIDLSVNAELYLLSAEITKDAFEGYGIGVIKSKVTIDYDAPYFAPNNSGSGLRFYNPTMVYYWAGAKDDYYTPEIDDHWLLPMLRIIDFSIWPPEYEKRDPEETVWSDFPCTSTYQVIMMYKGFRWAFDIGIFSGNLSAERKALLANTWQGIKYVLALVMPVDGILPDGHLVVEMLDYILNPDAEDTYQDLMEAIKTYDVWRVISAVIDIISLFKDPIKDYLLEGFGQDVSDSFLNGALEVIADVAGIATAVYDLTTQTIPFFYDLIEKPEKVFYWVQNCQITEGKPMINYISPSRPVVRKSVYMYGSFFGTEGEILIYPAGATEPLGVDTPTTLWTEQAIGFYLPNIAQGNYELVVRKYADGEIYDSPRFPVKVVLPSSGGIGGIEGGGGCTVARGSEVLLYPVVFLVPLLLVMRRRLRVI